MQVDWRLEPVGFHDQEIARQMFECALGCRADKQAFPAIPGHGAHHDDARLVGALRVLHRVALLVGPGAVLLQAADEACYAAKEAGRNCYVLDQAPDSASPGFSVKGPTRGAPC